MANSTTLYSLPDGRKAVSVTENKTLAIKDCGVVQNVITDGLTITMPAAVASYSYTIRNGGVPRSTSSVGTGDDGSAIVKIAPNGTEYFSGCELTTDASDTINNTKATSKVCDEVQLVAAAATGWNIVKMIGIWAKISL